MDIFPLTIFPEGGLVSSVITTVWVGVFVLCFFNLRFGWVLSGLVVPGYLVPLLIVKPLSALTITVEAVLTYSIVWLFSEKLSRGRFPALFGRDRFMGLVLVSILVRLSMDGYLLPLLAGWLEANFDRHMDWQSNLQSFGLVIISLLANQFWKPGLARGMFAAVVTTGITFIVIRYGLMEFTNFRISGVTYLYEGLASSILASPKAYIILVLTAMIASHMNVKYGWDFSGILIPALIALQWYQPMKIFSSFLEAIAIYALASLLLKLPVLANATIEGGRKLLLFFNISFAWKMALGWFVVWQGIGVKTTDFYGFGYLLSTLIAIKAHDKDIFPRLARSTLQVSLAGAVLGNLIGFGLATAMGFMLDSRSGAQAATSGDAQVRINTLMARTVGDAYVRRETGSKKQLGAEARAELTEIVTALENRAPEGDGAIALKTAHWTVERLASGAIALTRADELGHELLLFNPAATRDLAVIMADPTSVPGAGMAALALAYNQGARWLVVDAPAPPTALLRGELVDTFTQASRYPELHVSADPESDVTIARFANGSAAATDVDALRGLLVDARLSFDSPVAGQTGNQADLTLTTATVDAVSQRLFPMHTGLFAERCRVPARQPDKAGWRRLGELAFLRYEIAAPLLAGLGTGKMPYSAHAAAQLSGFTLDSCQIANQPHWLLYSTERNEGAFLFRQNGDIAKSVITYGVGGQTLPIRIGTLTYRRWKADNLLIAPFYDDVRRPTRTSFDTIWQELLRVQEAKLDDPRLAQTVQMRVRPTVTSRYQGRADVVLNNDRVGGDAALLEDLQSLLRDGGLRTEMADTSIRYAGFESRPGESMRYLSQTSGRQHVTAWLMGDGRLEQ